jgi:RNA polymerase sigma-70 factor (ECF subfamily)
MTALTLSAPVSAPFTPASLLKSLQPVLQIAQAVPQTQLVSDNASDEELISAICLGSERAMEIFYERYCRYAYALAYRILHESSAAEDIVQEVFLSVWRKANTYQRQQGSVYSWLQAIVHHRTIDRIRSVAHRDNQWAPLQAEGEQDPPSPQLDVWEQAWQKEQSQLIRLAMAQLPIEQRDVIELAYFHGYTHAEIAAQKQIPLGTVKGRMRLGLQKMKYFLQEHGLEAAS